VVFSLIKHVGGSCFSICQCCIFRIRKCHCYCGQGRCALFRGCLAEKDISCHGIHYANNNKMDGQTISIGSRILVYWLTNNFAHGICKPSNDTVSLGLRDCIAWHVDFVQARQVSTNVCWHNAGKVNHEYNSQGGLASVVMIVRSHSSSIHFSSVIP
jgi:hypothetical protein